MKPATTTAVGGISTDDRPYDTSRHGPHFSGGGKPDRRNRDQAAASRYPERNRVSPGNVIKHPGNPRPRCSTQDRRDHQRTKDAAIVPAFEDFGGDRPHDQGQAVSQRPLGEYHKIEQRRGRSAPEADQGQVADYKAQIADHPDAFPPDPVGQVTERDLTRDRDKAHQSKRPSRSARLESDLDQVFRLMDLDGIPRE